MITKYIYSLSLSLLLSNDDHASLTSVTNVQEDRNYTAKDENERLSCRNYYENTVFGVIFLLDMITSTGREARESEERKQGIMKLETREQNRSLITHPTTRTGNRKIKRQNEQRGDRVLHPFPRKEQNDSSRRVMSLPHYPLSSSLAFSWSLVSSLSYQTHSASLSFPSFASLFLTLSLSVSPPTTQIPLLICNLVDRRHIREGERET